MPKEYRKLILVVAMTAAYGAVNAQSDLEVVTITATKRTALLTDVPQSVQAISGDKLSAEGVVNLSDIAQIVPGVSQSFKASPGFEVLQVRGISSGATGDSLVGYYIDEIPFGLPNTQFIPPVNVFDLSRVEILRGPQGTLYGQGSMGGAIRLITRSPDLSTFSGAVSVGAAKVTDGGNSRKADVLLNLPIQKDVFGVRISAGTSTDDPYIANAGQGKNDNLRVKALANINQGLSVEGTIWTIRSRQDSYIYGQVGKPYVSSIDADQPRAVDTDMTVGNLTINYDAGIGDLVSSTSVLNHKLAYKFSPLAVKGLFGGALGDWRSDNLLTTTSASQEVRLASKESADIGWIGGVFLQNAKIRNQQFQQGWAAAKAYGLGPSVYTEGDGELNDQSYSLFGELSTKLMDGKVVPTIGGRYYNDTRKSAGTTDGVAASGERSYTSFNPKLNLAYTPAKGELLYVNVAKGFRAGATNSQNGATVANNLGYPAETLMPQDSLISYEIGGKWDLAGNFAIELAAYRIDWKDAQFSSILVGPNNVSSTVVTGGNDVEGTGVDFALTWAAPVKGLSFQLAGNTNDTKFTRLPPNQKLKVGDQIPGSPKESATLGMTYRTDVSGYKLSTNLSMNYRGIQSEMATGINSDVIQDLRMRVGLSTKTWDASIYGTNLNDQRGVAAVLNSLVVNPIQPRKIGLDLSIKF